MKNDTIKPGRFVDPTRDSGFKNLFCDERNTDVLKILVNSFLPADRQVAELEFAADRRRTSSSDAWSIPPASIPRSSRPAASTAPPCRCTSSR